MNARIPAIKDSQIPSQTPMKSEQIGSDQKCESNYYLVEGKTALGCSRSIGQS